ncbi:MAG: hypothetical protein ABIF82_09050 [Planctomycetota bacterium]
MANGALAEDEGARRIYDEANRMTAAQAENATFGTASYTVDENGNVREKMLGNGCYAYFTYDALNRPTEFLNCLIDGSALAYFTYDYDDAGRMRKCIRESGDVVYYGYDDAVRVGLRRHSR